MTKSNKTILIIGNYPPPYGGVPHHIEKLVEYLRINGWNCVVLSGGKTGDEFKDCLFIRKPTYFLKIGSLFLAIFNLSLISYFSHFKITQSNWRLYFRYIIYSQIACNMFKKTNFDLIVSYNLLSYGPIGSYLSKRTKKPHLLNIFGEIYKYNDIQKNQIFYRNVVEGSKLALSCSDHCGKSVEKIGSLKKVETVIYGIDLEHFKLKIVPDSFKAKYNLQDKKFNILFVGRLAQEMGLDFFLKLVEKAGDLEIQKSLQFLAIGQQSDQFEKANQFSKKFSNLFSVHSNIPYDDLSTFYSFSDVVIVPTRGDRTCSSLAAMEAMATQKAVIAFKTGGIPEIIEHNKDGFLVQPEELDSVIDYIIELSANPELRNNINKAAYISAKEKFDINSVNTKVSSYFSSLIQQ